MTHNPEVDTSNVPKVVGLHSGEDIEHPEPVASVVSVLEEALTLAKSGEIVCVAIAAGTRTNTGQFSIGGRCGRYELLGAVHGLSFELNTIIRDEAGN